MKKLILLLTQLFCHHKYQYTEINHNRYNTVECKWCGKRKIVKFLPLLVFVLFMMYGCIPNTPYSIVTKVKKSKSQFYTKSYKYIVTTDNSFRFYTNETFNVGDTVQITKKN